MIADFGRALGIIDVSEDWTAVDGPSTMPTGTAATAPDGSNIELSITRTADNAASHLVTITPPQSNVIKAQPSSGAHTLVLDVSYSMDSEAKVVNDDGDRVTHGWSQLDIVKHAACTYVMSLGASDYVCIVTYADVARVKVEWTACTDSGKAILDSKIRELRTEGSTNLCAGIEVGLRTFGKLPAAVAAKPEAHAMLCVVLTDGQPTSSTHPPGGAGGYKALVDKLKKEVDESHGPTAVPGLTAIGFGNQLDGELLHSFSDTFLHIPDPGSVGPFMVNLLAAARSTAQVTCTGHPDSKLTATHARLILEPASAVADVPGYVTVPWRNGSALAVNLGSLLYDTPRHVLLNVVPAYNGGAQPAALTASLELSGREVAQTDSSNAAIAPPGDLIFGAQLDRTAAVVALQAAQTLPVVHGSYGHQRVSVPPGQHASADLRALIDRLPACPLKETLADEAILALEPDKYPTWGRHYMRTLPQMLQLERRSNFRDAAMQGFTKDARGKPGLFEACCDDAEQCFATLKPPAPSKLAPAAAAARPQVTSMPDEFMRGGGCFGPSATVQIAQADGAPPRTVAVSAVRAGDGLVCEDGRVAPVRCVVLTECIGGQVQLTRIPNGPELTEWHPILDPTTRKWHFPIMLGARAIVRTRYVYNFVLAPGFPTVLVDGRACAALGHGLDAPVVAHPYWGTDAVIDDLSRKPGWEAGRVVMPAMAASADNKYSLGAFERARA